MAAVRPSTTSFIGVQCFNCSTMQVKQQKKSSNKWTCVVCNEKQSVRKIYARSSLAKDVRTFVQSFNMSRKVADEMCLDLDEDGDHHQEALTDFSEAIDVDGQMQKRRKKSDWSEYLDLGEPQIHTTAPESETGGPKIVTELPVEIFKKPRLSRLDSSCRRKGEAAGGGLYKPSFSKRAAAAAASRSIPDVQKGKCGLGMWNKGDDPCRDDKGMGSTTARVLTKLGSRWSTYLTEEEHEDGDDCRNTDMRVSRIDGQGHDNILDALKIPQEIFEEDIHPDFM